MKTAKEFLIKKDIKLNPEKITGKAWDEFNIKILEVMEEYAEQRFIEFVKWANENCWYKHYDQNDNCWTSRDEKRTETTENLYREFVLDVSPFSEQL